MNNPVIAKEVDERIARGVHKHVSPMTRSEVHRFKLRDDINIGLCGELPSSSVTGHNVIFAYNASEKYSIKSLLGTRAIPDISVNGTKMFERDQAFVNTTMSMSGLYRHPGVSRLFTPPEGDDNCNYALYVMVSCTNVDNGEWNSSVLNNAVRVYKFTEVDLREPIYIREIDSVIWYSDHIDKVTLPLDTEGDVQVYRKMSENGFSDSTALVIDAYNDDCYLKEGTCLVFGDLIIPVNIHDRTPTNEEGMYVQKPNCTIIRSGYSLRCSHTDAQSGIVIFNNDDLILHGNDDSPISLSFDSDGNPIEGSGVEVYFADSFKEAMSLRSRNKVYRKNNPYQFAKNAKADIAKEAKAMAKESISVEREKRMSAKAKHDGETAKLKKEIEDLKDMYKAKSNEYDSLKNETERIRHERDEQRKEDRDKRRVINDENMHTLKLINAVCLAITSFVSVIGLAAKAFSAFA